MKKVLLFIGLLGMSLNSSAALLTDLLNGGSITAGDKLFDNWSVLFEDSSDGRIIDTDNIDVVAMVDGGLDPGPGLQFNILNDEFLVEGDDIYAYLDFMFGFSVTVLDLDKLVKDNSLALTGGVLSNSSSLTSMFIEENIWTNENMTDLLGTKDVEFSNVFGEQTTKLNDAADFDPRRSIYVTKNILVEAIDVGESANLTSFEQRFSQTTIPEPVTLSLMALGLLSLGASRMRKA